MLRKLFLLSYFLFLISYSVFAQKDSSRKRGYTIYPPLSGLQNNLPDDLCHLRISLLTCTPGEDLYSTFGHSALRVTDTVSNTDIVYNYGTFNFEEPGFYIKFIRGKLLYYLSTEDFSSFVNFYKEENRGITEQVLNLNCNEKLKIISFLQTNLLPQNRGYKYDFLFDNCTTRLRDILEKTADSTIHFAKVIEGKKKFRELIYEYLDSNDHQWSKLGIDMFLGAKTDDVMDNREVMFLPDYLMKSFDSSYIGNKPIVSSKQNLFAIVNQHRQGIFITDPIFIFSLLLAIIVLLSFIKNVSVQRFLLGLDGLFFFIIGFTGLAMVIMWFGTDHLMTKNNYNLLWAWPTHLIVAFYMYSKKLWVKKYFQLSAITNSLVLIAWIFLPQHLNTAFIPVVMLLLFRNIIHAFSINRKL